MAPIRHSNMLSIFFTMVVVICTCLPNVQGAAKGEKIWPDFSCHPSNEKSSGASREYDLAKKFWEKCLENEKLNGNCAKTCILRRQNMVYQYCGQECNVTVNIDKMGFRLSQQLGYEEDNQPEGDQLVRRVEQELTKCKDNHPEIVTLQTTGPCGDKWNPFLSCIDKAFGCA